MAAAGTTLNTCTVQQPRATFQRVHMLFHLTATLAILYYRFSNLISGHVATLPWSLMTLSELIFSMIWFFSQAFRWRPVVRTVCIENLPQDVELPRVDVFICTADPTKEPTVEVMNTVLSAMGLDYPANKLAVYLSDDGGASSTLYAMKETWSFAKVWLPFCRRHGIKCLSPERFFSGGDEFLFRSHKFQEEEQKMKLAYEQFKENVERRANGVSVVNNRPPHIEIINDDCNPMNKLRNENEDKMPLLVYVSREKRPSRPHRFKAGALNTLLRVSGIMSNAPYMLVLDCDMYCNEPTSAKQAMCFHLDPKLSSSLSYVQYPQIFYNLSQKDIYDGQARSAYKSKFQGMDGLRGVNCSGTGYYLKKKALYTSLNQQDEHLVHPQETFGLSSMFITSLEHNNKGGCQEELQTTAIVEEANKLASCSYEDNTNWGKEVGYSYDSLLESTFTGYLLHTRGWRSIYLYPNKPCFLGCTTMDIKDATVQVMKWSSGLLQAALSRFSPLGYGMARMPLLQTMCYAYFMYLPLLAIAVLVYGVVLPLCLLTEVPLFPTVSDPWLKVFTMVYVSSLLEHLYDVLSTGGSIMTWWNEQRIYFINCTTGLLFGCMDVLMKSFGVAKANFRLTNKVVDQLKLQNYKKGKFDFDGANMFMIPLRVMVLLNVVCFIGGVKRVISNGNLREMSAQVFLSLVNLVFSYPILKGLVPNRSVETKNN